MQMIHKMQYSTDNIGQMDMLKVISWHVSSGIVVSKQLLLRVRLKTMSFASASGKYSQAALEPEPSVTLLMCYFRRRLSAEGAKPEFNNR